MSSPEYRVVLAPKAQRDIRGILQYTAERWGEKQKVIYRDMLYAALQTLKSNAHIGHGSSELPKTHRLHRAGSHEIVYRIQGNVVGVLRILHKRMSPPKHL